MQVWSLCPSFLFMVIDPSKLVVADSTSESAVVLKSSEIFLPSSSCGSKVTPVYKCERGSNLGATSVGLNSLGCHVEYSSRGRKTHPCHDGSNGIHIDLLERRNVARQHT